MALSFGLKTIADWLHKTVARLQVTSENNSGTEREFQTLTPIVDPDKEGYQPYFKALDYALSRDDVKNIAITGSYGGVKARLFSHTLKN